jgi:hypothetical protein
VSELITDFVPVEKSSKTQFLGERELVLTQIFFTNLFDAISGLGAVINQNRQIVSG